MNQTEQILKALENGESLTPLDALNRFGCMRIGARIWDLKKLGYPIITEMVGRNGKHYASYKIGKLTLFEG